MILKYQKAHTAQLFINKQALPSNKPKLEARWEKINGKLVCRWVKV